MNFKFFIVLFMAIFAMAFAEPEPAPKALPVPDPQFGIFLLFYLVCLSLKAPEIFSNDNFYNFFFLLLSLGGYGHGGYGKLDSVAGNLNIIFKLMIFLIGGYGHGHHGHHYG